MGLFGGGEGKPYFHEILHIGCGEIKGGWNIWGIKFWGHPLKWLVTLTTVLCYRTACDLTAVSLLY